MATTITDVLMTSDQTRHTARWEPDGLGHHQGAWVVSWLPQQCFRQDQAVTAMTLAEVVATQDLSPEGRWWLFVEGWAAELHVAPQQAVALLTAAA